MSIRLKIVLILTLGMLTAFLICSLAYINVLKTGEQTQEILDGDIYVIRAIGQIRFDLQKFEALEKELIRGQNNLYIPNENLDTINDNLRIIHTLVDDAHTLEDFQNLFLALDDYRNDLELLNETVMSISLDMSTRITNFKTLIQETGSTIKNLQLTLLEEEDSGIFKRRNPFPRVLVLQKLYLFLVELGHFSTSESDEGMPTCLRGGHFLEARIELLEKHLRQMEESVHSTLFSKHSEELSADLVFLSKMVRHHSRLLKQGRGEIGLRRQKVIRKRLRISRLVLEIETHTSQRVSEKTKNLKNHKSTAALLILSLVIVGALLIGLFGLVLMKNMSEGLGELLRASRMMTRGNLDERVNVTSRDELRELGESFNAMADYLQQQRRTQVHYNEIVSLLNSSVGLEEIISGTLPLIVERTDSNIGCVYLYNDNSEKLVLFESYSFSASSLGNQEYGIGVGLIGQAAKNRQKIYVSPVPEGHFVIDTGLVVFPPKALLVLPIVHLDRLLGVVVLGTATRYRDEQIVFAEEIVFQLAVTINNARFYETIESTASTLRERTKQLVEQQEQLQRVNRKLEDANRLKIEFLANVTHELRTPLNSITGFAELLLEVDPDLSENSRKNINTIYRNAKNLRLLIDDLLNISQIEAGHITVTLEQVDLGEISCEVAQMLKPTISPKEVEIIVKLSEDLPKISSDRKKVKQVMINLLGNAVKFTEQGTISIEGQVEDDMLRVDISDTGIGISAKEQKHIFEKFRQVDGTSRRQYGGTGLGLAISKDLMKILGGDIFVHSELGKGSTFSVIFPIRIIDEEVSGDVEETSNKETTRGEPKILILDSDPGVLVNIREQLRGLDVEVKSSFTVQEAADIIRQSGFLCLVVGTVFYDDEMQSHVDSIFSVVKDQEIPLIILDSAEKIENQTSIFLPKFCENLVINTISKPLKNDAFLNPVENLLGTLGERL